MSSLRTDLYHALRTGEPTSGLVELLEDFRDMGGSREEARHVLEGLRTGLHEEQEDKVLDLLDRVTGFCNPDDRIWPDPIQF